MIIRTIFFSILLLSCYCLNASERGSSEPFISGDTFRAYCDFIYDETSRDLDPSKVETGDLLFVKTDYIEDFFSIIHPYISNRYILITHNSDYAVPGNCAHHLDDDMIIAWFGQNVENCAHPKLHPIPIGIANKCWSHGDITIFNEVLASSEVVGRDILLYMNFSVGTYFEERSQVAAIFNDEPYCVVSEPKELKAYLSDLLRAKFVLSPRGNGWDCHRTWESLLMGAIPIVRSSSLDPMYDNLPVVIINDWNEINEDFLQKKYDEFKSKNFQSEKKFIDYWLKEIQRFME